ncbi:MAG: hypothetical protein JW774_09285 [Candidatus Aureabacteria bacterium]|nr:hypothetical protein [Candidatus Auribacterota bacterium]
MKRQNVIRIWCFCFHFVLLFTMSYSSDYLAPQTDFRADPFFMEELPGINEIPELAELNSVQINRLFFEGHHFEFNPFDEKDEYLKKYLYSPGLAGLCYTVTRSHLAEYQKLFASGQIETGHVFTYVRDQLKLVPEAKKLAKRLHAIMDGPGTPMDRWNRLYLYLRRLQIAILQIPPWVIKCGLVYYIYPSSFAYRGEKPPYWDHTPSDFVDFPSERIQNEAIRQYADAIQNKNSRANFLYNYFSRQGGTLEGLQDRIPYIRSLAPHAGTIALYLTPIFRSLGVHGYDTIDYFSIRPDLGNMDSYHEMLETAHSSDMRIILDLSITHTSTEFFAYQNLREKGIHSPCRDWYVSPEFDESGNLVKCQGWYGISHCPLLNFKNPEVKKYFLGEWDPDKTKEEQNDEWKKWVSALSGKEGKNNLRKLIENEEEFARAIKILGVVGFWTCTGMDGWRLDTPRDLNDLSFWYDFRRLVKMINPECYLVGETSHRWWANVTDGTMNYELKKMVYDFVLGLSPSRKTTMEVGEIEKEETHAEEFMRRLQDYFRDYPLPALRAKMNIMGGHDTARLIDACGGDLFAMRRVLFLTRLMPGIFTIYYGEEKGMKGSSDPSNRLCMQEETDPQIFHLYQWALSLGVDHEEAIQSAHLKKLYGKDKACVFMRWGKEDKIVAGVNNSDQDIRMDIPLAQIGDKDTKLYDETGEEVKIAEGNVPIIIPAGEIIFISTKQMKKSSELKQLTTGSHSAGMTLEVNTSS